MDCFISRLTAGQETIFMCYGRGFLMIPVPCYGFRQNMSSTLFVFRTVTLTDQTIGLMDSAFLAVASVRAPRNEISARAAGKIPCLLPRRATTWERATGNITREPEARGGRTTRPFDGGSMGGKHNLHRPNFRGRIQSANLRIRESARSRDACIGARARCMRVRLST